MRRFLTSRMKSLGEVSSAPRMPFLMMGALLMSGLGARAATRTVTSLADTGAGSLRAEVAAAAPGDTIDFGVTGVIELQNPSIAIAKDLTIIGPGAGNLAISGKANDGTGSNSDASIFKISGGVVRISGLSVRDGLGIPLLDGNNRNYGGAICMSGGAVTLTACTISNSAAYFGGEICITNGSMNVVGCTISNSLSPTVVNADSGGGIYVGIGDGNYAGTATLTMKDSTVSGHRAFYGGGVMVYGGTANISSSTISGNTAVTPNPGYNADTKQFTGDMGWGGGIFISDAINYYVSSTTNLPSRVNLSNTTISGNTAQGANGTARAGGGGIWNQGSLSIANSTVTSNSTRSIGGGILDANNSGFSLSNTIVSGNDAFRTGPDISANGFTSNFSLIGGSAMLGPLQNNGGPTLTHRLLAGSPAADAGDPNFDASNLPFDQRGAGFPRVKGRRLDIGAFEDEVSQSGSSTVVNTLTDHDDGICGVTDCTLREAVNYAPAGGTITFSVTGTITLTGGELRILRDVSIQGPVNSPGITISGNNQSRIFGVGPQRNADNTLVSGTATPSRVNFSNLTLRDGNGVGTPGNGNLSGNGGAIFIDASPTINSPIQTTVANCTFASNRATAGNGNGGAIRSPGVLTITNSTFFDNSALSGTGNGGAIRSTGTLTVSNSTFNGNKGLIGGGIIYNGSAFTLNNSIVAGNSAPDGPDISGNVSAANYNFVGNGEGNTGPAVTPATTPATFKPTPLVNGTNGNQVGSSAAPLNPMVGALANNGGTTQTMALLAGSPAIDAGSNALVPNGVTNDQRVPVFARIYGSAVDIGAFEVQPSTVATNVTLNGTQNVAFSGQLLADDIEGRPLSYSIVSGTLPLGLRLNTATGAITGTPTGAAGTSTLTFKVNNGLTDSNTATLTLNIMEGGSLVVTTLIDNSTNLDDLNSLREAIQFANRTDNTTAQTITFSVTGTIRLSNMLPNILAAGTSGALSITGPSGGITISGDANGNSVNDPGDVNLFNVDSNAELSLTGLTLSGGRTSSDAVNFISAANSGGAINNAGTLTVTSSTLLGNAAGNSGGAIHNSGTLTVTSSTLSGNTAGNNGGAISSVAGSICTMTITSSTFSGNAVNTSSPRNDTGGGALFNLGADSFVRNSTFTGNTSTLAGGAIYNRKGLLSLESCTIAGNSAPLNQGAGVATPDLDSNPTRVSNSIIADNRTSGGGPDSGTDVDSLGNSGYTTFVTYGYNLIGDGNRAAVFNGFNASGGASYDRANITAAQLNLGALGSNGGPTPTRALLAGSVAIDAGSTGLATDQRGVSRPQGAAKDIGAFELVPPPTLSIGNASVLEGNTGTGTPESGTKYLSFPLALSSASISDVVVSYRTSDGTATTGSDYLGTGATNASATIPAGQTTGTLLIAVLGDTQNEPDETLTVTLAGATNAALGTSTASGTIVNDDNAPTLSLEDGNAKGSAGSMEFTLNLSNPSNTSISVAYATSNGSAIAGTNYSAQSGTLTFTAGQTTKSITITGLTQTTTDKKFQVTLSNPSGATLARAVATGTILAEAGSGSGATASGVTVTLSGLRRNRATGRYVQPIIVQNNTGADIAGPLYLVLDNLAPNLSLYGPNINGYTANTLPTGSPYFTLPGLNRGTSQLIEVEFVNPSNGPVSFQTRVLKAPGTP